MKKVNKLYNFIADQLVDETEIVDRAHARLHFMKNRLSKWGVIQNDYIEISPRFFLTRWKQADTIFHYLRDFYSLSDADIEIVFELYKEKMSKIVLEKYPKIMSSLNRDIKPPNINENTDKKEKYSNYIKDILKKTLNFFYEEDDQWIELKCSFDFNPDEDFEYEAFLSTDWDEDLYYPGQYLFDKNFLKFCNDTFGIYEIESINRIYHWFVDFVRNEFRRRESVKDFLNESTDKKSKFYDRIVNHFINSHCEISFFDDNSFNEYGASFYIDIEYNYDEPWVYFANDLKNKIKFDVKSLYRNSDNYQRSFVYHLKNYGLTDINEVLEVHLLIMKELLNRLEKLNKTITIKESDDKKERFINFVIDDLLGKTDWWDGNTTDNNWHEKNVRIYTPFIDGDWVSTYALRAANQFQIPFIFHRIKEYCKKMYGSSDEEVIQILDDYKNKVLDEIMNQYSHLK